MSTVKFTPISHPHMTQPTKVQTSADKLAALFLTTDRQQRVRITRSLLSASVFVVCAGLIAYATWRGIMNPQEGAVLASGIWRLILPDNTDLGGTAPMASSESAVAVESILTFLLMLVILAVSSGSKELGTMAGIAVGATVGLEALFAGPLTGASMNPARSLAPALVSGDLSVVWIYVLAPVLGALCAARVWGYFKPRSASGA